MNKDQELTKQDINTIKDELIRRREQIINDLEDIVEKKGGNKKISKVKFPEYGDKSDENAQEVGEYTTNLVTDKVLESTLRDIESTLKRIEDGSYGICKYCKKQIPKKRMLARPVASACIECKTKLQSQL